MDKNLKITHPNQRRNEMEQAIAELVSMKMLAAYDVIILIQ